METDIKNAFWQIVWMSIGLGTGISLMYIISYIENARRAIWRGNLQENRLQKFLRTCPYWIIMALEISLAATFMLALGYSVRLFYS